MHIFTGTGASWSLLSLGGPGTSPQSILRGHQVWGESRDTWIFILAGGHRPNPHLLQGPTLVSCTTAHKLEATKMSFNI